MLLYKGTLTCFYLCINSCHIYRSQRARPIIVDPGLYLSKKSDLAMTTQRRSLPTAFKLFTGIAIGCLFCTVIPVLHFMEFLCSSSVTLDSLLGFKSLYTRHCVLDLIC